MWAISGTCRGPAVACPNGTTVVLLAHSSPVQSWKAIHGPSLANHEWHSKTGPAVACPNGLPVMVHEWHSKTGPRTKLPWWHHQGKPLKVQLVKPLLDLRWLFLSGSAMVSSIGHLVAGLVDAIEAIHGPLLASH